jgi:hypothetical protein
MSQHVQKQIQQFIEKNPPCPECGCLGHDQCAFFASNEPDEPDYNYTPYEESRSYRESMIDAGRRHLLK